MTTPVEDATALLHRLRDLVEGAKAMPLSASAIVGRDEALGLLEAIEDRLPAELTQARLVLEEREHLLASARREAEGILEAARSQAEGMVRRSEIAREARLLAAATVEAAEADGRRLQRQAQDYVERRLAAVEELLEDTLTAVRQGRERLELRRAPTAAAQPAAHPGAGLFDQDQM